MISLNQEKIVIKFGERNREHRTSVNVCCPWVGLIKIDFYINVHLMSVLLYNKLTATLKWQTFWILRVYICFNFEPDIIFTCFL